MVEFLSLSLSRVRVSTSCFLSSTIFDVRGKFVDAARDFISAKIKRIK